MTAQLTDLLATFDDPKPAIPLPAQKDPTVTTTTTIPSAPVLPGTVPVRAPLPTKKDPGHRTVSPERKDDPIPIRVVDKPPQPVVSPERKKDPTPINVKPIQLGHKKVTPTPIPVNIPPKHKTTPVPINVKPIHLEKERTKVTPTPVRVLQTI